MSERVRILTFRFLSLHKKNRRNSKDIRGDFPLDVGAINHIDAEKEYRAKRVTKHSLMEKRSFQNVSYGIQFTIHAPILCRHLVRREVRRVNDRF